MKQNLSRWLLLAIFQFAILPSFSQTSSDWIKKGYGNSPHQPGTLRLGSYSSELKRAVEERERLKNEEAEKQALEKKLEKEKEDYRKKNGITKEYLQKYTSGGHFLESSKARKGSLNDYDVTYYNIEPDGHLTKATFRTAERMDEDTYIPEEALKEVYGQVYCNVVITDLDTGEELYSAAKEYEKRLEQSRMEAEKERAAQEKAQRLKRQKLVRKYGAKYVEAALDGTLKIGMPLELVKETTDWFSVSLESESLYSSWYYVYKKRYTSVGIFTLKYAYIGVSKGKISSITYEKY